MIKYMAKFVSDKFLFYILVERIKNNKNMSSEDRGCLLEFVYNMENISAELKDTIL